MAGSKDFQQVVISMLETLSRDMRAVRGKLEAVQSRIDALTPQVGLHRIPKPRNLQKEYGRHPNMAAMFRKLIAAENDLLPGHIKGCFVNFPDHISDEEANEDAKRAANSVMCVMLSPGWEEKTWGEIYNADKKLGEKVIQAIAARPELAVFAQGGGEWGVRMLVEQKQKSNKRTAISRAARSEYFHDPKGIKKDIGAIHHDLQPSKLCESKRHNAAVFKMGSEVPQDESPLEQERNQQEVMGHLETIRDRELEQNRSRNEIGRRNGNAQALNSAGIQLTPESSHFDAIVLPRQAEDSFVVGEVGECGEEAENVIDRIEYGDGLVERDAASRVTNAESGFRVRTLPEGASFGTTENLGEPQGGLTPEQANALLQSAAVRQALMSQLLPGPSSHANLDKQKSGRVPAGSVQSSKGCVAGETTRELAVRKGGARRFQTARKALHNISKPGASSRGRRGRGAVRTGRS